MTRIKMLFYTALLLWTISFLIPYKIVDPEMEAYEVEYKHYVVKYCKPHQYLSDPIQKEFVVKDLPEGMIASCLTNGVTNMVISYNKKYWNQDRHYARMGTMFHELTHCYFMEDHILDENHFMNPYENYLPIEVIRVQLEEYLKEKCK